MTFMVFPQRKTQDKKDEKRRDKDYMDGVINRENVMDEAELELERQAR